MGALFCAIGLGALLVGCAGEEGVDASESNLASARPVVLGSGRVLGIADGTYAAEGETAGGWLGSVGYTWERTVTAADASIDFHVVGTKVFVTQFEGRAHVKVVDLGAGNFDLVGDRGAKVGGGTCGERECSVKLETESFRFEERWLVDNDDRFFTTGKTTIGEYETKPSSLFDRR